MHLCDVIFSRISKNINQRKALKEHSLRAFKLMLLPAIPETPISHHPVQIPCRLTLSQGSLSGVL